MRGSPGRNVQSMWHLARRNTGQLWRQKHGRFLLLAPLLVFLFTVVWSASSSESDKKLLSNATLTTPPPYSAAQDSAAQARRGALKLAANTSSANASAAQTHAQTEARTHAQKQTQSGAKTDAQTDEEGEAKAPDLAKALTEILEFPEDLDGPNDPTLLGVVSHDSSPGLQGMIAPSSRLFRAEGRFKQNVTKDHMVVAIPSDRRHLPLVEATKSWRKDLRTFVALDDPALAATHPNVTDAREIWGHYPDDSPLKGLHAGDTRAALTPFLAHQVFGSNYSWMLYGDDDTLFFVDSVSELLQDFDPSLPYFISDHYWWADVEDSESHFHPHEKAPRCMPCHWNPQDEAWALRADGYKPFQGYPACPCTAEHICRHDDRGFFDETCQIPVHPKRAYSVHGGAGVLISIGLMEKIPLSFMEDCMASMKGTGGDAFLSRCIWGAGYGFTDPGYSFYHWEAKSFDPGPESSRKLVRDFSAALLGACDHDPLEVISHVVTSHIRAIELGVTESVQVMHTLTSIYDRWRSKLLSVLAEANPRVSASSQHPFPSSSTRTQQNPTAASPALRDNTSAIPRSIPKGIPTADALFGSQGKEGNAELSQSGMQQESAVKDFLKFATEDEDNLKLQKQREEEEQKAKEAQGLPESVESESAAKVTDASTSTVEVPVDNGSTNASTTVDSESVNRMLEAASSGWTSQGINSETSSSSSGLPHDVGRNGTVLLNTNATAESAGKAALAEALARHNITAESKLAASANLHNDAVSSD